MTFEELRQKNIECVAELYPRVAKLSTPKFAALLGGLISGRCTLGSRLAQDIDVPVKQIGFQVAELVILGDLLCDRYGICLADYIEDCFNAKFERHHLIKKVERFNEQHRMEEVGS